MNRIVENLMALFVVGIGLFILVCAGLALGNFFAWIMGL
jgi:hypothetical protein